MTKLVITRKKRFRKEAREKYQNLSEHKKSRTLEYRR